MKDIYRFLIITAAALMLCSGCGLYSKYERPSTNFADSLYRRFPSVEDTTSRASMSWETIFTDPQLQEWIRAGIEHNTDMKLARLKVEEAEAALLSARWALLPGASFSADGKVGTSGNGFTSSFTPSVSVSWEADIFGRLTNARRGALARLEQSEAYRHAVQTQLVATIAKSYYTLLMIDEQLEISRHTLKIWEDNIRAMEALKRAGKTNEAAVLHAKANRLKVEGSVLTLEKTLLSTENSFAALLGMVPMKISRGKLSAQNFPKILSEGVPAELLSRRPDVRQAEMALASAFYTTNAAKAAFYPGLTLSGNAGWTVAGAAVNPGGLIASLGASLLQPIFGRGVNKARLKTAKAQQEAALHNYRQTILNAGVEVNNALVTWQTAKKRMEIDKKQIVNLKAAVWNTQLLMKHGLTNYLEVLTALQSLLQAELDETADRYAEIQGVIDLYHALGGGY